VLAEVAGDPARTFGKFSLLLGGTVNFGSVAPRAGRKVLFDSQSMRITSVAAAN
jgi:hypothetical protein